MGSAERDVRAIDASEPCSHRHRRQGPTRCRRVPDSSGRNAGAIVRLSCDTENRRNASPWSTRGQARRTADADSGEEHHQLRLGRKRRTRAGPNGTRCRANERARWGFGKLCGRQNGDQRPARDDRLPFQMEGRQPAEPADLETVRADRGPVVARRRCRSCGAGAARAHHIAHGAAVVVDVAPEQSRKRQRQHHRGAENAADCSRPSAASPCLPPRASHIQSHERARRRCQASPSAAPIAE